ncbi:MAG: DNA polymerase III subunit beta [Eubacteriales bacterium]
MKATFDKQKLLAALTPAASISQTKNTLVSVDGLLFECPPNPRFGDYDTDNPNLCRISAFDLEKGLRTSVECEVEEKGLFVINTVKILQIVRAMPEGSITIAIDDKGKVRITGGGGQSSFDITATPGEEFPSMPMFIGERVYQIPQYLIRQMIARTVYAVAQNDQRAAFTGAYFKIQDSELTVVGCDGNRLAAAKCTLPEGSPDATMLIPGKFLVELTKMLRDTEDDLTMMIGRKHIIFKIDSIYFFTRMLDMDYMDYEKLLPVSYRTEVFVSADELRSAVERASIVTEDKLGGSGKSPIKLDIGSGAVTLSSVSSGGSVHERVPALIGGAELSIGFNCRFLLDALRAVPTDCETLRIHLNYSDKGIMIEPASGTDFVTARPDETVAQEHKFPTPPESENKSSGEEENKNSMFMSFVMPIRMNK